jgi:hypothetical protein
MRSALRFMSAAIDATGNLVETHNPTRDFKEWLARATRVEPSTSRVRANLRDIKGGV